MFWGQRPMSILLGLLVLESTWASKSDNHVIAKDFPKFTQPIQNVSAVIGRDASLNCFIDHAQGFKIAWIRVETQTILTMNENVISRNHRFSIDHNVLDREWRLSIKEVKPSDQGWYMCQVNTDPMMSTTGFLEVLEPPQLIEAGISPDLEVREGESASLKCQADGNPSPNITWMREDKRRISGAQKHGSDIHFKRTGRGDMGAYLCMAANGIPPIVSRRIHLSVLYAPLIHVNLQVVRASVGDKITLNCSITGNPTPSLFWEVNGLQLVAEAPNHFLRKFRRKNGIFSNLQILLTSDSDRIATYRCHGNNSEGRATDQVDIHVSERVSYGNAPKIVQSDKYPTDEDLYSSSNSWEYHDEQTPKAQSGKYQEFQVKSTKSPSGSPKPHDQSESNPGLWPFTKNSGARKAHMNFALLGWIWICSRICGF